MGRRLLTTRAKLEREAREDPKHQARLRVAADNLGKRQRSVERWEVELSRALGAFQSARTWRRSPDFVSAVKERLARAEVSLARAEKRRDDALAEHEKVVGAWKRNLDDYVEPWDRAPAPILPPVCSPAAALLLSNMTGRLP